MITACISGKMSAVTGDGKAYTTDGLNSDRVFPAPNAI
jgi:hypothetical protein